VEFDRHTLVLLVLRPDAPEMTDEEAAELQDRHLAFRAELRDGGYLDNLSWEQVRPIFLMALLLGGSR
jgi:hypothetical protein